MLKYLQHPQVLLKIWYRTRVMAYSKNKKHCIDWPLEGVREQIPLSFARVPFCLPELGLVPGDCGRPLGVLELPSD